MAATQNARVCERALPAAIRSNEKLGGKIVIASRVMS